MPAGTGAQPARRTTPSASQPSAGWVMTWACRFALVALFAAALALGGQGA